MQQYNPLFNKIFGDEDATPQPTITLSLDFGEEYERLIREAIVDIAKNYRGVDCAERLANLVRALRSLITNPAVRDRFSHCALGYVYKGMPHDAVGATAELRRWISDANPHNWREELHRRRAIHEQT